MLCVLVDSSVNAQYFWSCNRLVTNIDPLKKKQTNKHNHTNLYNAEYETLQVSTASATSKLPTFFSKNKSCSLNLKIAWTF